MLVVSFAGLHVENRAGRDVRADIHNLVVLDEVVVRWASCWVARIQFDALNGSWLEDVERPEVRARLAACGLALERGCMLCLWGVADDSSKAAALRPKRRKCGIILF